MLVSFSLRGRLGWRCCPACSPDTITSGVEGDRGRGLPSAAGGPRPPPPPPPPPPRGGSRGGGGGRGGGRRPPPPPRGLRRLPLRDRHPQGEGADLEEGALRRRVGLARGAGHHDAPALRPTPPGRYGRAGRGGAVRRVGGQGP